MLELSQFWPCPALCISQSMFEPLPRHQMSFLTIKQVQSLPFDPYVIRHQASRGPWYGNGRWQPYAHPSTCRQSSSAASPSYTQLTQTDHGLHGGVEYSTYQQAPQHLSWPRTNSYSSFSPYEGGPTSSYSSHPPDYMLPDTNPMAQSNSYLEYSCSNKPHQIHSWNDQPIQMNPHHATQLPPSIYQDQATSCGEGGRFVTGPLRNEQALQFPLSLSTAGSSIMTDRTLPNPGTRSWNGAMASSYDGQPTSAVSHRSSITWPGTESSSSISHGSSHTSVSSGSGSINQDYLTDRRQACHESQDLGIQGLGFAGSSQAAASSDSVTVTGVDACAHQPQMSSATTESGALRRRIGSQEDVAAPKSSSPASPRYPYASSCSAPRHHAANNLPAQQPNGAVYARTQPETCRHRDTVATDFDSETSGYRPSESTASIGGITNTSVY